jgi:hypothetical protein
MSDNLTKLVQEEIDSGIGDIGRLQFILNSLKKGKTLCLCDQKYLKTRISRRVEEKRFILKDETENVIKNNENQKIIMTTNLQDCSTNLGQDKQTSLFLNKSEMITGSDIQKVILKVKKNLESTLERIEKLQRTFREKSKFELVEPKVDQNYLPNKSHDITEKQKSNNTDVKISGKNENKLKTDENTRTITKVLLVITIVTIVSTFVVLWFFGILEGKSKWQDYGLSYSDASTIVRYFLFATILTLVAWPAFGISRIIIYKRK